MRASLSKDTQLCGGSIQLLMVGGLLHRGSHKSPHGRVFNSQLTPAPHRGCHECAELRYSRHNHSVCFAGDRVVVAGGVDANGTALKTVEALAIEVRCSESQTGTSPRTGSNRILAIRWAESWHHLAPLDDGRSFLSLAVDSAYRLYAVGGIRGSGSVSRAVHVYDRLFGRWRSLPQMAVARMGAAVCCVTVPQGQLNGLQTQPPAVLGICAICRSSTCECNFGGRENLRSVASVHATVQADATVDVLLIFGGKSDDRCGCVEKTTELLLLPHHSQSRKWLATTTPSATGSNGHEEVTKYNGTETMYNGTVTKYNGTETTYNGTASVLESSSTEFGMRLTSPNNSCESMTKCMSVPLGCGAVSSGSTTVPSKRMAVARVNASAISIGFFAVICGGSNGAVALSSVEVYDVLNDEWHVGPRMTSSRIQPMLYVYGNNLYVTGGIDNTSKLVASSEKWVMRCNGVQGGLGYWESVEECVLQDLSNVQEQNGAAGCAAVTFELDCHFNSDQGAKLAKGKAKNVKLAEKLRCVLSARATIPARPHISHKENSTPTEDEQNENSVVVKSRASFGDRRAGSSKLSIREMRLRAAKM